jgi:hypothetical protein
MKKSNYLPYLHREQDLFEILECRKPSIPLVWVHETAPRFKDTIGLFDRLMFSLSIDLTSRDTTIHVFKQRRSEPLTIKDFVFNEAEKVDGDTAKEAEDTQQKFFTEECDYKAITDLLTTQLYKLYGNLLQLDRKKSNFRFVPPTEFDCTDVAAFWLIKRELITQQALEQVRSAENALIHGNRVVLCAFSDYALLRNSAAERILSTFKLKKQ